MLFLIDYDRKTGRTLQFLTYQDADRVQAEDRRLEIELDLNRRGLLMEREVVLLGAASEQAVRKTHERYFMSMPLPA